VAPSEKITLGHIGMGTQGFSELGGLLGDPQIQIVAVCDPNKESYNYVEWGKNSIRNRIREYIDDSSWREGQDGCPGGREIGRMVVDAYYKNNRGAENFKACTAYADFRELLESEKDVDVVKVMTPDHLHATVSIAAMKKGKHVVMHKPVANRMYEGHLVRKVAGETKMATHLLAYGSGAGNGRIVEQVKKGAIGALREIHCWTNRPVWPQYTEIPTDRPPVPAGFDWQLWLGPTLDRPYHPHYTHAVFRGWYDFGGGSMADMGIYSLWPVLEGLGLDAAVSAQAWKTHTCYLDGCVSETRENDFAYPTACQMRFEFAPRANMPGVELFWYDGGMKPRLPREIEGHNVVMEREGIVFVGEEGSILAGFRGNEPQLFSKGQSKPLEMEEGSSRSGRRGRRNDLWITACRGAEPSPGSFQNAAAITDTVNLGTVALRAETKVQFDSKNMKITNAPEAEKYLHRQYREGWEL
jgi:predicted dehydrogenase